MSINIVADFEKVSFEQFKKDWLKQCTTSKSQWTDEELHEIYNNIKLPRRGTDGSAGHDIYAPCEFNVAFGTSRVIPTGIRCQIDDGWFLDINPRSGQGFKFGLKLANTRGIIDSDYYEADNEGHIMIKLTNNDASVNTEKKTFTAEAGQAFGQGILTIYGITRHDDPVEKKRTGGFGSTDKK